MHITNITIPTIRKIFIVLFSHAFVRFNAWHILGTSVYAWDNIPYTTKGSICVVMSGVAQNYEERKSNKKNCSNLWILCNRICSTTTEEHVLICKIVVLFLLSSLHTISAVEICLSKENQLRSFAILVLLSPLSFNFRTVVVYCTPLLKV